MLYVGDDDVRERTKGRGIDGAGKKWRAGGQQAYEPCTPVRVRTVVRVLRLCVNLMLCKPYTAVCCTLSHAVRDVGSPLLHILPLCPPFAPKVLRGG